MTHSPIDVLVREVGLRDGLQNTATIVPTDGKLAWIVAELAAGVREIEVTSFVPPKLMPQFADAEEVVSRALNLSGLTLMALAPNLRGAERAFALGVHKVDYVTSVSRTHNLKNVRREREESRPTLCASCRRATTRASRAASNWPPVCPPRWVAPTKAASRSTRCDAAPPSWPRLAPTRS
jgi:isopropylmalate/homocitrate/citramalate synthase